LAINKYISYFQQAGFRYLLNRGVYSIWSKSVIYRNKHSVEPVKIFPVSKSEWENSTCKFFSPPQEQIVIPKKQNPVLETKANKIFGGAYPFFNTQYLPIPNIRDWHTDPFTGKKYTADKHYLDFDDFSEGEDIKNIWERARFCYLFDIIRYDHHYSSNSTSFVISEITSFIDANPINFGPHYISGQEIAIRVLNWLFALHFYQQDEQFDEAVWQKIMCSVYEQLQLIYCNFHYAEKFVRNNHVITEAAALFVYSVLFPQLKEAQHWQKYALSILEREGVYQIFNDGTYLQYSMNYHRVIIQVYTWILKIAKLNSISLSEKLITRLTSSLQFLIQCTNEKTGKLPNYGANDGSLFFPLNDNLFNDFRPQLQCLANSLGIEYLENTVFEDTLWFQNQTSGFQTNYAPLKGVRNYSDSGYYTFKEKEQFTYITCCAFKNRPSQADQLHIDIWNGDINIMRDGGSFRYNTDKSDILYFFGTQSHNTVTYNQLDQMLKGPRFIWYFWSKVIHATTTEDENSYTFNGKIKAFRQSGKWITHERTVTKIKGRPDWTIIDIIDNSEKKPVQQIWHPDISFDTNFVISAVDEQGISIERQIETGFYSGSYAEKIKCEQYIFSTHTNKITTHIRAL